MFRNDSITVSARTVAQLTKVIGAVKVSPSAEEISRLNDVTEGF